MGVPRVLKGGYSITRALHGETLHLRDTLHFSHDSTSATLSTGPRLLQAGSVLKWNGGTVPAYESSRSGSPALSIISATMNTAI